LLEVVDIIRNGLTGFQFLFALNKKVNTSNEHIDEFDFRETETIGVRNIVDTAFSFTVNTTSTALLKAHFAQDSLEGLAISRNFRDFDVDTASDTSTEIGWASKNVSEMFVPHEFVTGFLDSGFELVKTVAPAGEYLVHVTVLLHRDNTDVIFFVNPDEEVLGGVVPDTTTGWPIAGHTSAGEKWGDWLVEEEVIIDELILFGFGHAVEWVVLAGEFTAEGGQSVDDDFFDLVALSAGAPWWESEAADGAAGTASGGDDVVHVEVVTDNLGWVKAGLVLIVGAITGVSVFNDRVKEFLEHFVAFFVTSDATDSHNKWMAWVINTGLNSIIDGITRRGLASAHLLVELFGEHLSHMVVVLAEVWVFLISGVVSFVESHVRCFLIRTFTFTKNVILIFVGHTLYL
jgi:hypothetical protein